MEVLGRVRAEGGGILPACSAKCASSRGKCADHCHGSKDMMGSRGGGRGPRGGWGPSRGDGFGTGSERQGYPPEKLPVILVRTAPRGRTHLSLNFLYIILSAAHLDTFRRVMRVFAPSPPTSPVHYTSGAEPSMVGRSRGRVRAGESHWPHRGSHRRGREQGRRDRGEYGFLVGQK